MVSLFRTKSPGAIIVLFLLTIVVHAHFFFETKNIITPEASTGFFSFLLKEYVIKWPLIAALLIYYLIIITQAIKLNMVMASLRMYANNNYTVGMTYVLMSAVLTEWHCISPALIANSLIVWIFLKLSKLYSNTAPKTLLFNTGLIAGISVICYYPTIVLIPVIVFALLMVRPIRIAEWLIFLIGVLLPFYFIFCYLYLANQSLDISTQLPSFILRLPVRQLPINSVTALFVILLSLLIGLYHWRRNIKRMIIQIRKNWGIMLMMFVMLTVTPFLFGIQGLTTAAIAMVPLSVFVTNAFVYPKRLFVGGFVFWLFIGVIIFNLYIITINT